LVAKEKYKMNSYIKKFNPLEMEEEEVLALATGRERLLEIMIKEMQQCLAPKSSQHYMLYGPRGIGKSFFTRLLKIEHDRSALFANSLFIQLPEEQDNINFTADLLDIISTILEGGKLADVKPKWTITAIQYQASVKRLKLAIQKVAKEKNIKHIFVTQENLQVFIPKLDNIESGRFREFLSDITEITLIGSSLRPDLDNDYTKKLFQVFKKIDIEPWGEQDFLKYYERKALRSSLKKEKLEQLSKSKNKIRAIVKFTGGSPRLAVILSNLILDKNILDTTELLDGIIDDLTSYYQDITNDIPNKSKILFDMLIRKGENMTQSALAQSFDPPIEQSTIARSFSWLLDNYYVVYSKQAKGHTKHFYVRDRLYVLYYQKRQVYFDMPFTLIGIFVDFLAEFYSQKEQQKEIALMDISHPYSKGILYHFAKRENIAIDQASDAVYIKSQLLENFENKENKEYEKLQSEGMTFFEHREFDKAIDTYKKIIELKLDDDLGYYNLGLSYTNKGDYIKAFEAYQQIRLLKLDLEKHFILLGSKFFKNGNYDKAIAAYQEAILIKPDDEILYFNLGQSFISKDDFDNAIIAYQKAIELKTKDEQVYYNLGCCFSEQGNLDGAIEAYQKAVALSPNYEEAYNNLGNCFGIKGEYDKAIEAHQKAIALNPKHEKAYNNLGNSFAARREYDKAIDSYQRSIALEPNNEEGYFNLGNIFFQRGNYENAIVILKKGLLLNPTSIPLHFEFYLNLVKSKSWELLSSELLNTNQSSINVSQILGEALYSVTLYSEIEDRFFLFIRTYSICKEINTINKYDFVNTLCLSLYTSGRDYPLLEQILDELETDAKEDTLLHNIVEVFKYLIAPEKYDINNIHPDARTIIENILKENKNE
jgi:tetratricopeptide (TPR) repeat protein